MRDKLSATNWVVLGATSCWVGVLVGCAVEFSNPRTLLGGGGNKATLAPSGLAYSAPVTAYPVSSGNVFSNTVSTITGSTPITYTISPALPAGLSINSATGAITGNPTANTPAAPSFTTYTVTATNALGSTTTTVKLLTMAGYFVNSTGSANTGVEQGKCSSFSAGCTLPAALTVATGNKVVFISDSGTPYDASAAGTYTVAATATNLAVVGQSVGGVVLDGNHTTRVMAIPAPGTQNVTISNLTISNGTVNGSGAGINAPTSSATGTLTLNNVTITGNSATGGNNGGGLFADCPVVINNSTISNNSTTAAGEGSGVTVNGDSNFTADHTVFSGNTNEAYHNNEQGASGTTATFTYCTFTNNTQPAANYNASAIDIGGGGGSLNLNVDYCTFTSNTAGNGTGGIGNDYAITTINHSYFQSNSGGQGAAIFSGTASVTVLNSTFDSNVGGAFVTSWSSGSPTMIVTNSTFINNSDPAGNGGGAIGMFNPGAGNTAMTVTYSTFYGNHTTAAASGGAIHRDTGLSLTLGSNLFDGNLANGVPNNCQIVGGASVSNGYNFTNTLGGVCGATIGTDLVPQLSTGVATALANNGGPTLTLAITPSSGAYNAIPSGSGSCGTILTDQRGATRPGGANCDVGAFEY